MSEFRPNCRGAPFIMAPAILSILRRVQIHASRSQMNSLRSWAKILGFIVAGLLALVVTAFAALLAINAFDETLGSGPRAALEARHDSIAAENNLYFAILGLDFQGDADVNELGREDYARYLEAARANPGKTISLYQDDSRKRIPVVGGRDLLCGRSRQQEDCVEAMLVHRDEMRLAVASNRGLVERYRSIQKYIHFQNPVPLTVNSPMLDWQVFLAAKRLWLSDQTLEADSGHLQETIDAFRQELAFTRKVLAEPDMLLIDKVVLASSMRMDLAFISDLARNARLSDSQYSRLALSLTPLTVDERSLASVYGREFTAFANVLAPLADPKNDPHLLSSNDERWSRRLAGDVGAKFLKYNASMNSFWSHVEVNQAVSRGSCVDLAANRAKMPRAAPVPILGYLYNPIGKILSGVAASTGDEYIKSMCDLQGMTAIVGLQMSLGAERVGDDRIADFVTQSAAVYGDPYTGRPLEWRESGRSLSFQPGADRNIKYFPWPIGSRANEDTH
jgi:hypothetical protein